MTVKRIIWRLICLLEDVMKLFCGNIANILGKFSRSIRGDYVDDLCQVDVLMRILTFGSP